MMTVWKYKHKEIKYASGELFQLEYQGTKLKGEKYFRNSTFVLNSKHC